MLRLKPVSRTSPLRLDDREARIKGRPPKDDVEEMLEAEITRVAELQQVFNADARFALLVILQGRDASGKDGTIKRVFRDVNPQGVEITGFKAPAGEETAHDYLWRVHRRVPARGMFGVFNRSHYEDVLVPRVHEWIDRKECERRYEQINDFERMLSENHTIILKFFLHMSRDEQKQQLEERLSDPTKNWKFREGDLDDRRRWDDFTVAYRDALRRCSTKWAPWYVVPADNKKLRFLLVARTVADRLETLGLRYPKADPRVLELEVT